jgi:hypothetical protein
MMLINGEAEFSGEAAVGEVLRIYLVNTAKRGSSTSPYPTRG